MRLVSSVLRQASILTIFIACWISTQAGTIHLVSWVENQPYYQSPGTHSDPVERRGIVAHMLSKGLLGSYGNNSSPPHIIDQVHLPIHSDVIDIITAPNISYVFKKLNMTKELGYDEYLVISATTYSQIINMASFFKRKIVFKTPPVIVTYSGNLLLLIKFLGSIAPCLIVLYFASTVAVIVGAVIWVIEYATGNPKFPRTFGRGMWISFWFCFVTMATVGYGDRIPRNFIARLISIIWMVFGLTLVAVVTASIMGSISNVIDRTGQDIAVLQNSSEEEIVKHKLPANPVPMKSYDEIFEVLRKNEISAALLDPNVAAALIFKQNIKDLKMERQLSTNIKMRIFIYNRNSSYAVRTPEEEKELAEDVMDDIEMEFIPPKHVGKFHVRPMDKSFDDTDNGLIKYTTIVAAILIISGILSEVYNTWMTHRNKKEQNGLLAEFQTSAEYKEVKETQESLQKTMNKMVEKAVKRFNSRKKTKLSSKTTHGLTNVCIDSTL